MLSRLRHPHDVARRGRLLPDRLPRRVGVAARHRDLPGRPRGRGPPEAAPVGEALLAALHAFDGRPPELFAGDARSEHPVPIPYPAACRPQAWSAAAAVSLTSSLLGLRPNRDAEAGVTLDPLRPWTSGVTTLSGLGARGRPLEITVSLDGVGTAHRPADVPGSGAPQPPPRAGRRGATSSPSRAVPRARRPRRAGPRPPP